MEKPSRTPPPHAPGSGAEKDGALSVYTLLDAALDCVVMSDREGRVTYWNAAAERTFGYSAQRAVGKKVEELIVPPQVRAAHAAAIARVAESGPRLFGKRLDLPAQRADGSELYVELTLSHGVEEGGFTAFMRDISDRRRAEDRLVAELKSEMEARRQAETALRQSEEQLRQAQRMEAVGRLAGGIAHDFNNLLSIILTFSEFASQAGAADENIVRDIDEIRVAAERAATLTRQLLLFSRQQVVEPKDVNLNSAVESMIRMLERVLGEDVELKTACSPSLGVCRADPGGVEQVIMNLVLNARDAMPNGGKVTITTENVTLDESYAARHYGVRPGEYVALRVSDTGVGMDEETVRHIFEPFYTTKERGKGTGLGLSTVYGIVQQAEGHVHVDTQPDVGTTFHVYFRRTSGSQTSEPPKPGVAARTRGTILLVEDEASVRAAARSILLRAGYQVLEAADGEAAARISSEYPSRINLLLTDVVMPKLNGRDLAKIVSQERPSARVLFMSGYTDNAIASGDLRETEVAFLQKPFTPKLLLEKVESLLKMEKADEDAPLD